MPAVQPPHVILVQTHPRPGGAGSAPWPLRSIPRWPTGFHSPSPAPPGSFPSDRNRCSEPLPQGWSDCAGPAANSPCHAPQEEVYPSWPSRRPVVLGPGDASHPGAFLNPGRQSVSSICRGPSPVKAHSFSLRLMASTWGIPYRSSHSLRSCLRLHPRQPSRRELSVPAPDPAFAGPAEAWSECHILRRPGAAPTVLRPCLGQGQFPVRQSPSSA